MSKNITSEPGERPTLKSFTGLNAWKEAHNLSIEIYKSFPKKYENSFASNEMKKYICSVTTNTAKGFYKKSLGEKLKYFYIAQGSLTALSNLTFLAKDVSEITENNANIIQDQIITVRKLMFGLIKHTKTFLHVKHAQQIHMEDCII